MVCVAYHLIHKSFSLIASELFGLHVPSKSRILIWGMIGSHYSANHGYSVNVDCSLKLKAALFCGTFKVRKLAHCVLPTVFFPLHLWGYNRERHKTSKHLLWFFRSRAPHRAAHTPRISFSLTFGASTGCPVDSAIVKWCLKLVAVELFPFYGNVLM